MSLNLTYKAEVVVDISNLTREEWLTYRKKGSVAVMLQQFWEYPRLQPRKTSISIRLGKNLSSRMRATG